MFNTSQTRLLAVPRHMPWTGRDPPHGVTENIAVLQMGRDTDVSDSQVNWLNHYLLKFPPTHTHTQD